MNGRFKEFATARFPPLSPFRAVFFKSGSRSQNAANHLDWSQSTFLDDRARLASLPVPAEVETHHDLGRRPIGTFDQSVAVVETERQRFLDEEMFPSIQYCQCYGNMRLSRYTDGDGFHFRVLKKGKKIRIAALDSKAVRHPFETARINVRNGYHLCVG